MSYREFENGDFQLYLDQIGAIPLLKPSEELELAKLRKEDPTAVQRLVEANLRFVVSIAKHYAHYGVPLTGLVQEGNMGLMKAAHRYDETKGFKFISYAVWWIRQAITKALVDQNRTVRVPSSRYWKSIKAVKQKGELEQIAGEGLMNGELDGLLSYEGTTFCQEDLTLLDPIISLDAPISGEDATLGSSLVDERAYDTFLDDFFYQELGSTLATEVSKLPSREAQVINLYFGLNGETTHTLETISHLYGITRERVRQIKERALRTLKNDGYKRGLHDFLEEL